MKSLPVHVIEGKVRGERCCGPPSLPMRGHSMRGVREEERKEEERRDEESSGCCSASPVPSHYQRPKEVDGDYSYAYRYKHQRRAYKLKIEHKVKILF